MRGKSGLLLLIALGCGMVASVGISQVVMEQGAGKAETPMVEIFVATRDISITSKITAENIRLEKWPQDRLPDGAITQLSDVENKFANQSFFEGEPILAKKLMDSANSVASTIPNGHQLYDFTVDEGSGPGNYLQPGDRVDVIGFFERTGGIEGEGETKTVLRGVQVFGIDGVTVRQSLNQTENNKRNARVIQLLVTEAQLEPLNTASYRGKLRLSLCPPGVAASLEGTPSATGEEFLKWMRAKVESEQKTVPSIVMPTAPPITNNREMAVITPNGIITYRFEKEGAMPTIVSNTTTGATAPPAGTVPPTTGSAPYYTNYPTAYPTTPSAVPPAASAPAAPATGAAPTTTTVNPAATDR